MFSRTLEANEQKEIEEGNKKEENPKYNLHHTEIISPIIAIILGLASLLDKFWFFAYFGLIFAVLGIFLCNKKKEYLNRGILILNVVALAICFFVGGLWIMMYISSKI